MFRMTSTLAIFRGVRPRENHEEMQKEMCSGVA